jgi:predicted phage tail protein
MSSESDGSPAMNGEATERTPEQVQAEIEETRAELGDTVEALVAKTDVKGQAKQAVNDAKATVADKAAEVKQTVVGKKDDVAAKAADVKQTVADKKDDVAATAQESTPDSVGETGRRAVALAQDNRPALIVAGAFALGLLIGSRRGR